MINIVDWMMLKEWVLRAERYPSEFNILEGEIMPVISIEYCAV
jgi:hypothetical protein